MPNTILQEGKGAAFQSHAGWVYDSCS